MTSSPSNIAHRTSHIAPPPGFAETTLRNAITYAWFQARGGLKSHFIMTALIAAGLAFLIGLTTSVAREGERQNIFSFWAMALLVLQSSTVVLVGGLGIVNAIRQDANSGMHDSMRLMRISPIRVVIGYLTGASTQALNVLIPCSLAGGICSAVSGVGFGPWIWGATLLLTAAVLLLFIAAFLGMMFKQGAVIVVVAAVFGPTLMAFLPFVPGLLILAGPAAGRGALATRNQEFNPFLAITIICQALLASQFFFATAHRFRYPLLPAFGIRRGLILLFVWTLISLLGLLFWQLLYPSWLGGSSGREVTGSQIIGTLIPSLLISLVPVLAVCREWANWRKSVILHQKTAKPPAVLPVLLTASVLVVTPAFLAETFLPATRDLLPPILFSAAATLAFLTTLSAIARRLLATVPKYAKAFTIVACLTLMFFPLAAEWCLAIFFDRQPLFTAHTLTQFSPIGVYLASWAESPEFSLRTPPCIGTFAQIILAIGVSAALSLPKPTPVPGPDARVDPSPEPALPA